MERGSLHKKRLIPVFFLSKSFMVSHARRLLRGTLGLLLLALLWAPAQAQSSPTVYSLPITISNQGVAYDAKTNQIVATDYKNNVVQLVNQTTGASTSVTVGTRPVAAAVYTTSSKSYAYIGNEGSDNISVIDLSTKSVIKTISVGQSPASIAINSSTGKGYVANLKSDNVSILTLSTNTVAATTVVGSEPASVAINTATGNIYVANSKNDTVSVIDGTSNAVTTTIPVGQSPVSVVVNSGKSMAYSVNSKGDSISAINLSTNAVTATIPVGSEPVSMAIDAAKNMGYVANLYDDSVSVLNLSSNTVTGTYAVGRDPIGVAFYSPYLIVATQRGDGLWIINTTTQSFGTTVPVGKDPDGVAVDPTTNRALTANEKCNDVSIVDLSSAQLLANVHVGKHPAAVAINSETQTALTANEKDDTLSVIDLTTKSVIGTIAVGRSPLGVAINPNLNIAATANRKTDSVSVVDISNRSVIGTIAVGKSPSAVAIQPTGNIGVVANRKDNTVSVLDLSSRTVLATIPVGKDPAGVGIDPDLNLAVVANDKDNTASIIDLGSKTVVAAVTVGKRPHGVAVNPSTHRAAVANFIDGTITVIDLPSRTVAQTLSAGKSAEGVDINPNTNQAAVTLDSFSLLVILQLNNPAPVISGLVPASITAGSPAFTLTVQGSQFITTSVVKFNGQAMATQFVSTTKLTASIPASAITTAGTVPVTVTNPAPVGGASNAQTFTVNNPVPSIATILPTSVAAGSGSFTLTVNGTNFLPSSIVTFNGLPLATTFMNSTQLTATVPASDVAASQTAQIAVINPAPGGGNSTPLNLIVALPTPPVITVTAPANNSSTNTPTVQVSGSVDDPTAALTINGAAVPLNGKGFTYDVMLTAGLNSILLTATNLSGKSSSATVFITLDQTPPGITITTPVSGLLINTPQITVTGTVNEPVASVLINGAAAQVSGTSFTLANFTLAEGENTITATATDRAGNAGNANVSLTLDTQAPVVTLSAPGQAAAGQGITISTGATDNRGLTLIEVNANGTPIWSFTQNAELSTQHAVSYTFSPDLAPGSVVALQVRATDLAGNTGTATAQLQINQGPSGPGYIQGEVYDDSKGLLLEGATAGFVAADGHGLTGITTQEDGAYFTEAPKGSYLVTLSKVGFISVERTVVVTPEKKSIAIDARLTPVSTAQNLIDTNGGTIKTGSGVQGQGASIELSIPAGALTEQADIRVTPVSNQGLAGLLPNGWSPIAVIDLKSFTLNSELRTLNFVNSATLKVPVLTVLGLAPTSPVTLSSYDTTTHQWLVQGPGTASADGGLITSSISSTGQYAFILPDSNTTPVPGTPLSALSASSAVNASEISAAGRVVPPAAPPSEGLQATGQIMITPASGSNGTLTSGLIVNANVSERFDLLSGESVVPTDYIQDLVLYRYPCITNIGSGIVSIPTGSGGQGSGSGSTPNSELGTQNSGNVGTTFPVTPSHQYTIVDLMMGKVSIGITLRAPDAGGSLVGADGGRLLDADGTVIAIPAGALTQTVPIQTKTIAPSVVSSLIGPDFTLLRAVNVSITGAVLSTTAELSIPVPAGFNANLPVVIAKAIDVRGATKLKLVAFGKISGSLITSAYSNPPSPPFDKGGQGGIYSSGQYFFLQAKAPLGFVTGQVTDASGNPFVSALVTSNTCSLADLTNASGTYLVASTVSNFTASAMDIYKYDTGTGAGTISGAGQTVTINLQVKMVPPRVLSISPANGEQYALPSTAVVITFSKPLDKTTITSANIVLTDPEGKALEGAYSVNPDGTVVTFYPSALLQSLTHYTLSISKSIKDLQGYPLGTDVMTHFTIKNTTPPPMPPAGSITATFPDANGYITVSSTQGSVVPNVSVLIINDTTGEIVTVQSQSNGSFTGKIRAQLGDEIKIMLMDSSGNQTLITYITFKSDDGKYLVTTKGGTVEGDGGLKLDIPEGALLGPTVIKIMPVTQDQLPQAVPKGGNFLAAVKIDTGGVNFKKEVALSVPAPSNMPANAEPFLAMPSKLVNPDGTEENVYDIQDSAKVANGRLTTACLPFMYVPGTDYYVFLFPDFHPVILSGRMYRDINQNGMYDEGADIPINGGVVRSPEAWSYIARTNSTGFYATYSWAISNIGTCRDFRVTAIDLITQRTQNTTATLCEPPYLSRKDFVFPTQGSPSADKEPPKIVVNISSDQGFVSGVTPLGATISIEARVSDNVAVNQSKTSVEIKAPNGQPSPALSLDSTATETVNGIIRQVFIYKATYQPQAAGPYSVKVYAEDMATDPNGVPAPNAANRALTFSSVNQTDIPAGVPGPPSVLDGGVFPPPGSTNLTATTSVQVYFTEAVNNVNSSTFTLYAVSSLNGDPSFVPGPVAGAVVASIEGGRMKALFTPAGNLHYSTHYEVRLSSDITDVDEGNHLVGNTASGYVSTFETKVPDVYDLGDTQFHGRDIAIIGDYAYVAGGATGWHIENISDPTKPSTVYTENHTQPGSVTWSYRGIAAQEGVQISTANGGVFSGTLVALTDDVEFADGTQFTNIRFYDVTNPASPQYIGHERLGTNYSGIAGSVVLSGQYAYVATVMVGVQVVDISKAMGPHDYGESIVGYFDSMSAGYQSPTDLAMLKGKLYATATSGHFLVLDTSQPAMPTVIGSIDPSPTFRAWRVGVAGDFTYVDDTGTPQTMDIAIVSGGISGELYFIDITNPAAPFIIATLSGINATDIKINAGAGMAFVSTWNGVMAIDIKNPKAPRIIANVTDMGSNPAIAEKGGWVFTANASTGMKVVNLDPVYLELYCADTEFGERVKIPCTDYYPALGDKSNGGKKTITLLGRDWTWITHLKPPARVKFNSVSTDKTESSLPTVKAVVGDSHCTECTTVDSNGLAYFTIQTDQNFNANEIYLEFEIDLNSVSGMNQLLNTMLNSHKATVKLRVRNNSNVTFGEVLNGQAVFVQDNGGGKDQNGEFRSIGAYDSSVTDEKKKKFYFVQELLNQVIPRTRKVWKEPPSGTGTGTWVPTEDKYNLIEENGYFDQSTSDAIRLFRMSFIMAGNSAWRIGNTNASFDVTNGAVNYYDDDNTTDTFRKLMKDYNYRDSAPSSQNWVDKIIDKETLVGKDTRIPAQTEDVTFINADVLINSASNRHDTGLYELYKNVVERFVNKLIDEGEHYAGLKGSLSDNTAPTDLWIARTGEGPANQIAPLGWHGPGMSYSNGGKDDIANFNSYVANCQAPNKDAINKTWSSYLGNLAGDTCSIDTQTINKKQWAGLYDAKNGEINVNSKTQPFWPTYWSGIDCNGLVQRVMMAGNTAYGTILSLHVAVDNIELNHTENTLSNEMAIEIFFTPGVSYEIGVADNKKIKKGDFVRYDDDTHISMVYSLRWGESRFKKRNYDVMSAYGIRYYKYNLKTESATAQKKYEDFSRKVIITGDNIAPYGSYGRLKLWD